MSPFIDKLFIENGYILVVMTFLVIFKPPKIGILLQEASNMYAKSLFSP